MSDLQNNVVVSVSVDDTPLSQQAFSIGAIVGPNYTFGGRTEVFSPTDLAGIADVLTNGTEDPEYQAAAIIAQQQKLVSAIVLIREDVADTSMTETLTAAALENNEWFGVMSVDEDETKQADMAAYAASNDKYAFLRSADPQIVDDNTSLDNNLNARIIFDVDLITANVFDVTINGDPIASVPFNTDHDTTMADILVAIDALTDITSILDTEDTNNRTIIVTSASVPVQITGAVVTGGATQATVTIKAQSLAAKLNGLANDNAMLFYQTSLGIGNGFFHYFLFDAASMGRILPKTPGSYTAKNQKMFGVQPDKIASNKSANAYAKGANVFVEILNKNVIQNGTATSGGFVDVHILRLWLKARIGENVFLLEVDEEKIPFTNAGFDSIGNVIEQVLEVGKDNGGISEHEFDEDKNRIGGWEIILPRKQDLLPADIVARIYRGVKVKIWLAGAVHVIVIDVTLQL